MSRNKVQFQKGLSEPRFHELYGCEERCREALFRWRWPNGFSCPRCGATRCHEIAGRKLYQCAGCRHQVSLTAGTLFHATKLGLTTWFLAIYHMTQSKKGISSIELGRRLGVTQTTAWKVKQKLMQAMLERVRRERDAALAKIQSRVDEAVVDADLELVHDGLASRLTPEATERKR